MSYKVKKGFEEYLVTARIFDGQKTICKKYGDCDQEELEELFLLGCTKYIAKTKGTKTKKKKRDNAPSEPPPTLEDEPQKD